MHILLSPSMNMSDGSTTRYHEYATAECHYLKVWKSLPNWPIFLTTVTFPYFNWWGLWLGPRIWANIIWWQPMLKSSLGDAWTRAEAISSTSDISLSPLLPPSWDSVSTIGLFLSIYIVGCLVVGDQRSPEKNFIYVVRRWDVLDNKTTT